MKKIFAFLTVFVLAMSVFSVTSYADNISTLSIKETTCSQNDVVGVTVSLSNNQGLWGMLFTVSFDAEHFQFCEVRNNNDVFANDAYMVGPKDFSEGKVNVLITPTELKVNNFKNGNVCTIFFKVDENTPDGKYAFDLNLSEKDICDVDGKKVDIRAVTGEVTVDKNYKPKTTQNTEKMGEVIATTANNANNKTSKNDKTTKHYQNVTEVSQVYVTNKNGETVTNKNGEKVTKQVYVDKDTGEIIGDVDDKNALTKNDELIDNNNDYLIIAIIVILAIAVAVVAIVADNKKKKKNREK